MKNLSHQRGSAYLVVLLALVVLTIIGLSLVMVTQTEVQLGSNERTINRTFYAAESGIKFAIARYGKAQEVMPFTYIQNESPLGLAGQRIADEVKVSVFAPIGKTNAAYSSRAKGDTQYFDIENYVTATARRVGWQGTGMPPANAKVFAQSQVGQMIRIVNGTAPQLTVLEDPSLTSSLVQ
jgi:type II secretory pathway component PulK